MILVDTSVWVDHLRHGNQVLSRLLEGNEVLVHPFVIGELACGNLANRRDILALLSRLPAAPLADQDEVLLLIDQRRLMGRGIGFIDAHLLAATLLATDARLWTRDRRLGNLALALDRGWDPGPVLHES